MMHDAPMMRGAPTHDLHGKHGEDGGQGNLRGERVGVRGWQSEVAANGE
jgi:hypothetical protein